MKIVHTSDWHAGRVWKGLSRHEELEAALEHLASHLEKEKADLLLVTGDVFDSGAPHADAEKLVFGFFKRVGRAGTRSVVIAGNHDSPRRLEAWGSLTELVDVHVVAQPRGPKNGGVLELPSRSGKETAVVAALPFAAPAQIASAAQLAVDETASRQRYDAAMARMVSLLATSFRPDAINLLLLHTHLVGAVYSRSERAVHLGDEWAAQPQTLPVGAHYVALGHIHKPQRVQGSPAPAYYAGSPLQLDFGESGEEKSFVTIDARARQPVSPEHVPYRGTKPLVRFRGTMADVEEKAGALATSGWLHVTVALPGPDPDLTRKVRRLLPNAVVVACELPAREEVNEPRPTPPAGASPRALYAAYAEESHGEPADEALLSAFDALRAECEGPGA